jgi:hypothetical protein
MVLSNGSVEEPSTPPLESPPLESSPLESPQQPLPCGQRIRRSESSLEGSRLGHDQIRGSSSPPPILGRRQRDTEEWTPRTKARLGTFAKENCEKYGVPLKERAAIIEMSQVTVYLLGNYYS